MKKYRVVGEVTVVVVTLVDAEDEKAALNEAAERDVSICIHGSEMADGEASDYEWVLEDGTCDMASVINADEIL